MAHVTNHPAEAPGAEPLKASDFVGKTLVSNTNMTLLSGHLKLWVGSEFELEEADLASFDPVFAYNTGAIRFAGDPKPYDEDLDHKEARSLKQRMDEEDEERQRMQERVLGEFRGETEVVIDDGSGSSEGAADDPGKADGAAGDEAGDLDG